MNTFSAIQMKNLVKIANKAISFNELEFPYLESYEEFNNTIKDAAQKGVSSIKLDFIDTIIESDLLLVDILINKRRIYLSETGVQASYNVYNYPNYLISKGFKVEIINSIKKHGYKSKAYLISW